jgi:homoserine dehydrogenase
LTIKVGIIGVGTVGSSVANILKNNKEIISARAGKEIEVVCGVVKNINKKRDVDIKLSSNIDDVINDENIDIVVELMGGVDDAFVVVKNALENKKAVITANKALLAYHRYELQDIAKDIPFEFEASVAGGIPIINALRDGLSANHIKSIRGILNGTCNYMLTQMVENGANYDDILKEAQELGYAELDPTLDVNGSDAAHKLLVLASIAYGIDAKPEDILIEGIENIKPLDIEFANEFGYSLKLLGIAKKIDNKVELRVHPTFIDNDQLMAKINGVMNGVSVVGDMVGETLYYGAGAGGNATASAVVANIIDIARDKKSPMLGFKTPLEGKLELVAIDDIISKYYIRLDVKDETGVLSAISSTLAEHNISIESMLQKPNKDIANLLLSTYECKELSIREALIKIESLPISQGKPHMIRIEN